MEHIRPQAMAPVPQNGREINAWAKRLPTATEPSKKAAKLAAHAQAAADVRAFDTDPNVIAYRIERMRTRVDRLIWTGLIMGLAFTAANVQAFAARGAQPWTTPWIIAWLLDPMVSLVLVGVLLGEQILARHQIHAYRWVRRTKWTTLALTYAMNTWTAWTALDASLILLHSVPPIVVFCAAEAVTTLKHQITAAVRKAYAHAAAWWADVEVEQVLQVLPLDVPEELPEREEGGEGGRAMAAIWEYLTRRALPVAPVSGEDRPIQGSDHDAVSGNQGSGGESPGDSAADDLDPAPAGTGEGQGAGQAEKQAPKRKRPARSTYLRAEKNAIAFVVDRARRGVETRWQDVQAEHPARSRNWCEDKLSKGIAAHAAENAPAEVAVVPS